jgi:hypothetical protein
MACPDTKKTCMEEHVRKKFTLPVKNTVLKYCRAICGRDSELTSFDGNNSKPTPNFHEPGHGNRRLVLISTAYPRIQKHALGSFYHQQFSHNLGFRFHLGLKVEVIPTKGRTYNPTKKGCV